jgi:ubiquinone/menaquinone biosynthesis C-methylase UbiE
LVILKNYLANISTIAIIWDKLHEKGYHPSVEEALNLVKTLANGWRMGEWENLLGMEIPVKGKTVLEIGCGGGWYLAQMLQHGASRAIGFEVTNVIIEKAKALMDALNLKAEFYQVDERYLDVLPPKSVDIIYQLTVFQHISEEATKAYIQSARRVLKDDGLFINQFLMNDKMNVKNAYAKNKEGIVYYSESEIKELIKDYSIVKQGKYAWTDKNESYWMLYALRSAGSP